ncbi:MAG: OadG family protein [Ignavibacteriales bacterium]|nr:OadG family protein [Ignavibacteriales bacterium]
MKKKIFLISFLALFLCGVVHPQDTTVKSMNVLDSSGTTAVDTSVKKVPVDDGELIHFNIARVTDVDIKGKGNSLMLTVIGMGVVFAALWLLYVSFAVVSKVLKRQAHLKQKSQPLQSRRAGERSLHRNCGCNCNGTFCTSWR